MLKIAAFLALLVIGVAPAFGEVYIQNDQKFFGNDGAVHIVGEIQNEINAPISLVSVDVTLYSKSNDIVDVIRVDSFVNYIMPGMKSPFEVIVPNTKSHLVDRYAVDVNYKVGTPKSQVIEIKNSEIHYDVIGNLIIKGMITNNADTSANIISIIATFYDKNGDVAFVSKSYTKPDYLKSNDDTYFVMSVPRDDQLQDYVDYTVVAESEEYAAAPEFPIGTTILLASSVSSYLALSRYSNKFKVNFVDAADPR